MRTLLLVSLASLSLSGQSAQDPPVNPEARPQHFGAVIPAAVSPTYGQQESPKTEAHENHTQPKMNANPPASPTPPAVAANLANQDTSDKKGNGATSKPEGYFCRLLSPENLPNIGLFIAGVTGIIVAVRTLKVLERQALSMRRQTTHLGKSVEAANRSADAALLNAQALINSERPWLLVTIEQRATAPHIYDVRARNAGRSPAALVDGHCLWKRRPTDFALPDILNDPIIMPAQNLIVNGEGFPVRTINLANPVEPPDEEGIGGDPQPLHAYGRLRYWDTFVDLNAPEAKPYVTEWMFWYDQVTHRFRSDGRYAKTT